MAGPGQAVNSSRLSQVWETTKAKGAAFRDKSVKVVTSDKFLIAAMVAIAAIAAATVGIGATSLFGHFHQLNALGHYAIAMVAAGGVATVLGAVCLGILIKHVVDDRKARKANDKKIDDKLTEDHSAVEYAKRIQALQKLPLRYQAPASKLQPGHFAVIPTGKTFAILAASKEDYTVKEGIKKTDLARRKAEYAANFHFVML